MAKFNEAIFGVAFDDEHKDGYIEKREEIVRCADCKHFKAETKKYPALCRLWLPRNLSRQYGIEPDGFCAWGERRQP